MSRKPATVFSCDNLDCDNTHVSEIKMYENNRPLGWTTDGKREFCCTECKHKFETRSQRESDVLGHSL